MLRRDCASKYSLLTDAISSKNSCFDSEHIVLVILLIYGTNLGFNHVSYKIEIYKNVCFLL